MSETTNWENLIQEFIAGPRPNEKRYVLKMESYGCTARMDGDWLYLNCPAWKISERFAHRFAFPIKIGDRTAPVIVVSSDNLEAFSELLRVSTKAAFVIAVPNNLLGNDITADEVEAASDILGQLLRNVFINPLDAIHQTLANRWIYLNWYRSIVRRASTDRVDVLVLPTADGLRAALYD